MPLSWRLVIPAVEWEILGVWQGQGGASASDADMGSLGKAGERKGATLRVRYTGKPPFSLQLLDLSATAERTGITVGRDDLDLVAAPALQQAGSADEYQVPVELLVRRSLSQASLLSRWLSGTDYSGHLKIQGAGLPASPSQEVSFRLHNPSLYQRYVQPFYRLLLPGIVTIPLSVVIPLLLLVFIWKRRKDASVERLMRRSGRQTPAVESGSFGLPPRPVAATQSAGPPRWTTLERSPKPSDAPGGSGHRIPQRQVRPAETKKDAGMPASTSTRSPVPASVPPPHRRTGTSRPTPSK
jgi:hypothetical protein